VCKQVYDCFQSYGKDDRCLHVALSVTVFLKCQPNLSLRKQSLLPLLDVFDMDRVHAFFKARQQRCCRRRPKTQHTPVEHRGLTANKISIIEQLAYKNKAFIIVLQETHCITRLPSLNQRRIFFIFGDLSYFT